MTDMAHPAVDYKLRNGAVHRLGLKEVSKAVDHQAVVLPPHSDPQRLGQFLKVSIQTLDVDEVITFWILGA
jgi:hypothetical protein